MLCFIHIFRWLQITGNQTGMLERFFFSFLVNKSKLRKFVRLVGFSWLSPVLSEIEDVKEKEKEVQI